MKLGIKQIIIIFLVALLGGACGTYGIYELTNKDNSNNKEITSEVQYTNSESGVYEKVERTFLQLIHKDTKAPPLPQFFSQQLHQSTNPVGRWGRY